MTGVPPIRNFENLSENVRILQKFLTNYSHYSGASAFYVIKTVFKGTVEVNVVPSSAFLRSISLKQLYLIYDLTRNNRHSTVITAILNGVTLVPTRSKRFEYVVQ